MGTTIFRPKTTDAEQRLASMLSSWGFNFESQFEVPLSHVDEYTSSSFVISGAQTRLLRSLNRSHSFYLDFLLPSETIWIEVNGPQHYSTEYPRIQGAYDRARMSYIRCHLYQIYGRFFKLLNLRNERVADPLHKVAILRLIQSKARGSESVNSHRRAK